jgi:hypothetical protein
LRDAQVARDVHRHIAPATTATTPQPPRLHHPQRPAQSRCELSHTPRCFDRIVRLDEQQTIGRFAVRQVRSQVREEDALIIDFLDHPALLFDGVRARNAARSAR